MAEMVFRRPYASWDSNNRILLPPYRVGGHGAGRRVNRLACTGQEAVSHKCPNHYGPWRRVGNTLFQTARDSLGARPNRMECPVLRLGGGPLWASQYTRTGAATRLGSFSRKADIRSGLVGKICRVFRIR